MCFVCEILLLLIYVHVCDECVLNVWTDIRDIYSVEKTSKEPPPQAVRVFFIVQNLLKHGPNLYNGHLWGPVTFAPAERLVVELLLLLVGPDRGMNPDLPHAMLML